jgi:hypothetical protein
MDAIQPKDLAEAWYELLERTGTVDNRYGRLRSVVSALLPKQLDYGAAGTVDGEAVVMAVRDQRLLVVRPTGTGDDTEVRLDAYPLSPHEVSISVTDNPADTAGARNAGPFRRWEFTWSSGARVTVLGELWREEQWRTPGPDASELFARQLARQLGWPIPEKK